MIYSFLMTQYNKRTKGDWIYQVEKDLHDFEINECFTFLQNISTNCIKTLVKKKAKIYAFNMYKKKQENHSKIKSIYYEDLKMQP